MEPCSEASGESGWPAGRKEQSKGVVFLQPVPEPD
jgi:hypothetical protein